MKMLIYTVKKGDTLYEIAKRCGTTVNMIARYNGIADPDVIYAGQILRIPVSEIPCGKGNGSPEFAEYIVRRGDTLASIAVMYDTSVGRLADINGISDPDRIFDGQVIKIPVTGRDCGSKEYIVKRGDTLYSIAQRSDTDVAGLADANNIADPDVINEGQGLTVPNMENDNEDRLEYTVVQGDTLWEISRKFGVSVPYLINLNKLADPDRIFAGQILLIRR